MDVKQMKEKEIVEEKLSVLLELTFRLEDELNYICTQAEE